MDQFPLVVATQDWHPVDHISFGHQSRRQKNRGDTLNAGSYEQPLFPMHCIEKIPRAPNSWIICMLKKSHEFLRRAQILTRIALVDFFDCSGGKATEMDVFLKDAGIEHLFVAGLATNYCVKETALDGVKLRL